MKNIPAPIQSYLESEDGLVRAQLLQAHPTLQADLGSAEIRQAIVGWLSGDEAWRGAAAMLAENCIEFLTPKASQKEAEIIKQFLLHTAPHVRLRAYEFLLTLYFPDRNQEALFMVLHAMLSDQSETIRREAAGYIQRADAVARMRPFLERWQTQARERGEAESESFELIARLLGQ